MDIKNRITGEVYFVTDTVKAEIVNRAEDYRYSSAIDWVPIAIGRKGFLV